MRALVFVAAVVAVLGLAYCDDVGAKEFRVYTCLDRDTRPLAVPALDGPVQGGGWTYEPRAATTIVRDQCPVGQSWLGMTIQGSLGLGDGASLVWRPAPGTVLTHVTMGWVLSLTTDASRGHGTVQMAIETDRQGLAAENSPVTDSYGTLGRPMWSTSLSPAARFAMALRCLNQCIVGRDDSLAMLSVLSAAFTVDDPSPPVGGVVGTSADAQIWSGAVRLQVNATDEGAGLHRAVLLVDDADAVVLPLGNERCRDVGPDPAINEFVTPRPCPLRINDLALDVDTARLPQGRHEVRVALEDAAGNRTVIFGPVVRMIAANGAIGPGSDLSLRGAANGEGASDDARLTAHWGRRGARTRLVSRFGRSHVVRGRLRTADGTPVARAVLDVISRTTAVDARTLAKRNGPVTGADGRWSLVLPRNVSSRDVTFRYRSHVGDTIPTATASVRLRVRAGLRLAIHPRVARRGQTIRFAGRLLGGPLPRGGKQIVLVARARRGPWLRFNVIRTGTHGRFRATYRFQQPGAVQYRFRALSRAEAAYPYLAGGSNVVTVVKR